MSPETFVFEPEFASKAPATDSMQSDGAASEDTIVSGSRGKFSSPPHSVVVVSQDPVARLTLWLPGQVQDAEHGEIIGSESEDKRAVQVEASDAVSNDLPEQQPSTTDEGSLLNTPTNGIGALNFNVLTLADWMSPPHLEKAAIAEDSQIKTWSPQEVEIPLLDEITISVLNQDDFNQMKEEPVDAAARQGLGTNDAGPVIRSKLQFSKGVDGLQMLSYEEEVVKQQEGEGGLSRCGIKRKREPRQKGLRSTFLDLLR